MLKQIKVLIVLILLGLIYIFSGCEKEFESKTHIIVNGDKTEESFSNDWDKSFWTSEDNDFAAKHYYLDDDGVEDFRVTIVKSWGSNLTSLTYAHKGVYLLAETMQIKTVIDSAWLDSNTYTLVKSLYDENTVYSSSAIFETDSVYVPIILSAGDKLELNQNYIQQVLDLDYERFDDESDPEIGDYTHDIRYSPMAPVTSKFIGIKQEIEGKTYLGWIKISTTNTFDVKVRETYLERVQ